MDSPDEIVGPVSSGQNDLTAIRLATLDKEPSLNVRKIRILGRGEFAVVWEGKQVCVRVSAVCMFGCVPVYRIAHACTSV